MYAIFPPSNRSQSCMCVLVEGSSVPIDISVPFCVVFFFFSFLFTFSTSTQTYLVFVSQHSACFVYLRVGTLECGCTHLINLFLIPLPINGFSFTLDVGKLHVLHKLLKINKGIYS